MIPARRVMKVWEEVKDCRDQLDDAMRLARSSGARVVIGYVQERLIHLAAELKEKNV